MKHIDINPRTGEVTWDRYFAYLEKISEQLPDPLRSYAREWGHYSLDGKNSLHDAWLVGFKVGHKGSDNELALEFLGAWHDRRHVLRYLDVRAYSFNFQVNFLHGDRDVLVHEFTLEEDASITHEILFVGGGRIVVTASQVIPDVGLPL